MDTTAVVDERKDEKRKQRVLTSSGAVGTQFGWCPDPGWIVLSALLLCFDLTILFITYIFLFLSGTGAMMTV